MLLAVVIGLIVVALAFDFINGFHDAANSIATIVSTRVLSPVAAVAWAAFFNFVAAAPVFFGGELRVAQTVGKGIIQFDLLKAQGVEIVLAVIFAALVGAIVWNLITWWLGLPSSSSHALAGVKGLVVSGILKISAFIVLSPLIGLALGSSLMIATAWIVRRYRPGRVDTWFRKLQLLSSAVFSYSHGSNDAQKVMGIIAVVLYGTIWTDRPFHVTWWIVLLTHSAIALGTFFGGWRIVRTMGYGLTKLQPIGGFAAETGGGVTILFLSHIGIPVSTTHTITGAIVGVGATKGYRAVRWGLAGRIIWAWIFTIPASALVAAGIYVLLHAILH
jgi:inorganic phosphate transporter, PiT family